MSIKQLSTLAALAAGLALAICPVTLAADDDDAGGGVGVDTGLVFEGTTECTAPEAAFSVFKDVTVCFDPVVADAGGDDDSSDDGGAPPAVEVCDPFPDDGLFTYVYKIRNDPTSALSTLGLEVTVLVEPGAIVDAGVLPSIGVPPSFTLVEDDRVTWFFAGSPILPGDMSQELYIVSPLGPEERPFAVLGEFGIDCTSTCIGPGVVCEFCETGGGDDNNNDDSGSTPTNILFNCPSGPAAGDDGPVEDGESTIGTGTLDVTQSAEACFDPACGSFGCDAFPEDGLYTYTYVLTNEATSTTSLRKFKLSVGSGSVVDAGVLDGDGVVPSTVRIRSDRVIWKFEDPVVAPGQTTRTLYIRSARAPGSKNGKVYGTDDSRATGDCISPVS